jgi:hypothetical protein
MPQEPLSARTTALSPGSSPVEAAFISAETTTIKKKIRSLIIKFAPKISWLIILICFSQTTRTNKSPLTQKALTSHQQLPKPTQIHEKD